MKVGDLVKIDIDRDKGRVGVITGFDEDNDPIVCYYNQAPRSDSFYHYHVEVINETN